jgi:hypothetical protein
LQLKRLSEVESNINTKEATMARNTEQTADTSTAEAPTETNAPAPEASSEDQRFITLNVPEGDPSGLTGVQKRTDVIRTLAKTGEWTRGDIAKHISKLQGKKVPYQIVFQATRGIANVKAAPRGESAEAAPAPADATAGDTVAAE